MRITGNRYLKDIRRYQLALRLIQHEARTNTICSWTGLSDEHVRNLCRSYSDAEHAMNRHRGPSPNRFGFFLRSARLRNEAGALGGLFRILKVTPHMALPNARSELPGVSRGERLCTAYELFRYFVPESLIAIEHAFMLAITLARGKELQLVNCVECNCSMLIESYRPTRRACMYCHYADHHEIDDESIDPLLNLSSEEKQQKLF